MTAGGAHARALEAQIRWLLHGHAETVVPGDGLPLIRARIARRPWWRRALAHLTASKTAAPGGAGTAATAAPLGGTTAMTIISRHARDLHAGDVITADPDHDDRPVRWRVSRPPVRTRDGEYALADVVDLATGESHVTYYPALQSLTVEPAGGAA